MTKTMTKPKRPTAFAVGAAVALAAGLQPAPAASVLITNKDATAHTVVIDEAGEKREHEIAPTSSLDNVCLKGCTLDIKGVEDGSYSLPEGNEIVTIEDATLFYEGAAPRKSGEDAETAEPAK